MKVSLITPRELTEQELAVWHDLIASDQTLSSPFFHPVFIQTVSDVRGDVELAVLSEAGKTVGFFPFQRGRFRSGLPVGAGLSEFHGLIAAADLSVDVPQLLRECNLRRWDYDHLPLSQSPFATSVCQRGDSPYMDLSQGFAAYVESKRRDGSSVVKRTERKARKMAREVGPLSFTHHTEDERALDALMEWKRDQHQRTGVLDIFQFEWVNSLMRRMRETDNQGLRGSCSMLSANGEPVAVHLGIQTPRVAHMWFVSYNRKFSDYSPGMILFLRMAEALAEERVQRLDFGPGGQRYKQSLMSASIPVGVGALHRSRAASGLRRSWYATKSALRATPARRLLRAPAHLFFRTQQWLTFREPA